MSGPGVTPLLECENDIGGSIHIFGRPGIHTGMTERNRLRGERLTASATRPAVAGRAASTGDGSIHVKSIPLFLEAPCLVASSATRPLRRSLVLLGWIIRHRPRPGRASSGRRGRSIPAADAPSRCGPAG